MPDTPEKDSLNQDTQDSRELVRSPNFGKLLPAGFSLQITGQQARVE